MVGSLALPRSDLLQPIKLNLNKRDKGGTLLVLLPNPKLPWIVNKTRRMHLLSFKVDLKLSTMYVFFFPLSPIIKKMVKLVGKMANKMGKVGN